MVEKINHTTHEKPVQLETETISHYEQYETETNHSRHPDPEKGKDADKAQEALHNAKELAKETEKNTAVNERSASPAEKRRGAPSKSQREKAFKASMRDIQDEMDPNAKLTSKLIHNPFVEKSSDLLGSTLARPNAMLSGSICAFICITLFYFIAKNYGYQLSGFETIAAFVIGWVIGVVYDYLHAIIRPRK